MKVVHIESGLGNQMLSYCELLALEYSNPNDKCYVETLVFDYPECNEITCQWNGYELSRIFGIDTPDIKTLFSEREWHEIHQEIHETQFWSKNWNYPVYFTEILRKHGLMLKNLKGNYEDPNHPTCKGMHPSVIKIISRYIINNTYFGAYLKRFYHYLTREKRQFIHSAPERLYIKTNENVFTGLLLLFKFKGNNIEKIEKRIKEVFKFPEFTSDKNVEFAKFLDERNAVFIHARRGDMLSANGWCYKYGYFRRAVKYIKKHVDNPVFVFFTNPGSVQWCKDNADIFALDYNKDAVYFVDWNKGEESYRDMQLMSHCKHGIITNSTFGWWGAYFINNPDKITISPGEEINTTHHC